KRGRLRLIACADGTDASVRIHQDARVYAGLFDGAERAELALGPGRRVYVQSVRGSITVNGTELGAGDGLKVTETATLTASDRNGAEALVFDLPGADTDQ